MNPGVPVVWDLLKVGQSDTKTVVMYNNLLIIRSCRTGYTPLESCAASWQRHATRKGEFMIRDCVHLACPLTRNGSRDNCNCSLGLSRPVCQSLVFPGASAFCDARRNSWTYVQSRCPDAKALCLIVLARPASMCVTQVHQFCDLRYGISATKGICIIFK
jgi:hypothetical protein